MPPEIEQRPLSYAQRLERRPLREIRLVVIHCTELPDLAAARAFGEKQIYPDSRTGNSGHFYIDRDGRIQQWVPLDRVAHHAKDYNRRSVGIELVNAGRYPHWYRSTHQRMVEPYPGAQIDALAALLGSLAGEVPGLEGVAGHADLDTGMLAAEDRPDVLVRRKMDPGPLFPWPDLLGRIALRRVHANEP